MKLMLTIALLLAFAGSSYAFEDPRWEKSVSKVSKQSIQKKIQVNAPLSVVEIRDDEMTKYEEEKLKKTLSTLKESPMPLRLPDTILRVMFLPYVDSKNVLRNSYYAFLKVEDGKWVLGEYLTSPNTRKSIKARVFSPLEAPLPAGSIKDEKKEKEQTEQGAD